MPTYEYACEACDQHFEKFQSITEPPIRKCPACGRRKVQRLISGGSGFIFKGSGFYTTDYRSENYKQAAQKDKAPAPASGKSESKSTTKKKEAA